MRIKPKSILLALFFLLITALFRAPLPALACSCAPPGAPDAEMEKSAAVFSGRVTAVEAPGPVGGVISSADRVKYTFQVSKVWKGPVAPMINVSSARDSASCGYEFQIGEEYLVYATEAQGALTSSLCSRTQPLVRAEEDLQVLGAGQIPPEPERPSVLASPLGYLSIGAVLLGLGLIALWVLKYRRDLI